MLFFGGTRRLGGDDTNRQWAAYKSHKSVSFNVPPPPPAPVAPTTTTEPDAGGTFGTYWSKSNADNDGVDGADAPEKTEGFWPTDEARPCHDDMFLKG